MNREEAEHIAKHKWNLAADEHNQWNMLSGEEQEELIDAVLMENRF